MQKAIMKIGENFFRRDVGSGLYPILSLELNRRVKNKEATNVVVVGEAGSGKSYAAIQIALGINKRFGINQIIFTYKDYIEEIKHGKMGVPIVFDEPSYAMGKREWYQQINQALVKTVESQRFLVRPLIIPIINLNLLDKTIRDYCIQFQVHIVSRGKARVYRMYASQGHPPKMYRYLFCTLQYPILNHECPKKTCLGCKQLSSCQKLRAKYERKKEETQLSRYDEGLELARKMEEREVTLEDIAKKIIGFKDKYFIKGRIHNTRLKVTIQQELGRELGMPKTREVKILLLSLFPTVFTKEMR